MTRYQTNTASVLQRRSWHYDALGRAERVTTEIGASQWSEETTFDQYGRVFQHFDASGDDNGLRYHYRNGHVEQLQEARDGTGGVVYQKVLATDAYGNVTAAELDDGAIETFASYEQDSGRLLKLTAYRNSVEIQEVDYLFDALGNLQHRHDRTGSTNTRERFTYDTLNRLNSAQLSFNGGGTWQGNHLSVSYAANGNITSKSGVGSYGYGAGGAGPHAVTSAGGITYQYDANGNNTSSSDGRTISYTVFDQAELVTKGSARTRFDYGVGQGRYRRSDEQLSGATWNTKRTTTYLSTVEYIEDHVLGESYFLRQIAGVALQRYYVSSGVRQTDFLIKDHLGSIHTVVQDNGALERMQFGAFGERVSDVDWTTSLGAAIDLNEISTRGFTGHEHVDSLGIIHMNGRIYDPKLGRFLQADPFVQFPKNGQNLNRYSYVMNNPLSYTDPSGYFLDKLWDAVKPFIGIIVGAVLIIATGGSASPFVASWYGAAAAGAISGAASAAVNGGNILRGALLGGIAGAGFQKIAVAGLGAETEAFARAAWGYGTDFARRSLSAGHDFVTAGLGASFGGTGSFNNSYSSGSQLVAVGAATVGATSSSATRNFANGAYEAIYSDYLLAESDPIPAFLKAATDLRAQRSIIRSADYLSLEDFNLLFPAYQASSALWLDFQKQALFEDFRSGLFSGQLLNLVKKHGTEIVRDNYYSGVTRGLGTGTDLVKAAARAYRLTSKQETMLLDLYRVQTSLQQFGFDATELGSLAAYLRENKEDLRWFSEF